MMEVSAKTGQNVDKMFMEIAKELIKRDGSVSKCERSSQVYWPNHDLWLAGWLIDISSHGSYKSDELYNLTGSLTN